MKKQRFTAKSFGIGTAASAVLVAFGVQLIFQLILSLFTMPTMVRTWIVVILNQVIFTAVALIYCFTQKVDPIAVTGLKRPPKWYYFPIFILIAVACITCFGPMSGLFSRLLAKLGYDRTPKYYIPLDNGGLFALAFLALTILPAVGEETMLRGVLMSGAKKKSPLFAIFYTALIFALMHGNLNQLVHQILLGIVMGYLVYLTGSIYASATVHFANNAMALLLDYGRAHDFVDKNFYWYIGGKLDAEPTIIGISISLFGLLMLLTLVTCLMHRDRSANAEYEPLEGKFLDRINAYLYFLAAPNDPVEQEGEKAKKYTRRRLEGYELLVVIVLAAVLAAVVLLTLIPSGGKG